MPIDNHEADFEKIVRDAGIPITQEDMQARWDKINKDQGSKISNDSKWSPFWRLISAIVTAPAMWVVQFLINNLLPNSFIKTAKGTFLDILAWGLNLKRKKAVKAEGVLTFTRERADTAITIPAGTYVHSRPINNTVYELMTTEDTAFPDTKLSVDAKSKAVQPGQRYNLAPGYYSVLPNPIPGVTNVNNDNEWLKKPGADAESDDELRLRCRNQFTAVGQFHHDAAYKQIITEFAGIRTDYLYFQHNAPRGPGSANCYIMIESGVPPKAFVDRINKHINDNGYHGHGDSMICFQMPAVITNVQVSIWAAHHITAENKLKLAHRVENLIKCAFRQNTDFDVTKTWPNSRFSFSKLTQDLHRNFPNEIASLKFKNDDVVTLMALPTLGTIKVRVI